MEIFAELRGKRRPPSLLSFLRFASLSNYSFRNNYSLLFVSHSFKFGNLRYAAGYSVLVIDETLDVFYTVRSCIQSAFFLSVSRFYSLPMSASLSFLLLSLLAVLSIHNACLGERK